MRKRILYLACLSAVALLTQFACMQHDTDPAAPNTQNGTKDPRIQGACLSPLQIAVIGTSAYGAIAHGTQLEEDFDYKLCSSEVFTCRLYVKWMGSGSGAGTTYKWEDNAVDATGCNDWYLRPGYESFVEESVDRVVTAAGNPLTYHFRCNVAENPVTGEKVYAMTFDATNICGGSNRRQVIITVTPPG